MPKLWKGFELQLGSQKDLVKWSNILRNEGELKSLIKRFLLLENFGDAYY